MSRLTVCLCALLGGLFGLPGSYAAEYPDKPIRWIVPWPPGGGVDIATRALGPSLAESLGQNMVVDNRPGASGMLGTSFAARAPADGYTLLMGAAGPNAILPHVVPKIPYHGLKDIASISLIANTHIRRILDKPEIRERLHGFGLEVVASTPAEFQNFRVSDFANWAQTVRKTNTRFEP